MSNSKYLADLLKICSVLLVFAVMPAMAETINIGTGETQTLTGMHTDVVVNDGSVYFLASEDKNQLAVLNIEDATISNVTTNYANKQSGFVKGYDNSKIVVKNSEFSDNKSDYYSAIWAVAPATGVDGGILEISNSKFLRNESNDGAAVGAMWLTDISNTLFEGNKATDANGGGGALLLGAVSQSKLTDVIFKGNTSAADGGAISMRSVTEGDNSEAKLDIFESEFSRNIAEKNGGAIYATFYGSETVKDSVYIEDTDFTANSANDGGAIYTEGKADLGGGVSSMKVVDSDFVGNAATNYGGAIYNASTLIINDTDFEKNDAYLGGAMFLAAGSDTTISDADFDANTADFGGALYTSTGIKNVDITDSTFTNNVALGAGAVGIFKKGTLTNVKFSGNKATDAADDGAGALFLGALSQVQLNNVDFNNNSSAAMGGAIAMRGVHEGNNKDAKLDIIGGSFTGNTAATNGGAIFSTFYDSENVKDSVYINGTEFSKNIAERGGAIYTEGKADLGGGLASMKIEGVTFTENVAAEEGGAVQNRSTLNISDSTFVGNIANGNYGGAFYNSASGTIETLDADFSGNKIVNEGVAIGGAIANIGTIGEVTGLFDKNIAQATETAKGGAIYTFAGSAVDSVVADFTGNIAVSSELDAIGGAIVNDGTITKLHQSGQGFVNNSVSAKANGWAGALYNSQDAVISELVADFTGNSVSGTDWAIGGALVNQGTIESLSGTFMNNAVTVSAEDGSAIGGAVYNSGTINFDGDVLFSNNTAAEGADIYNDGTVNIVSGTTTIDGGIMGDGTLNVASDAILNIGTVTVQQEYITVDGILAASLLNSNNYAKILGNVSGDGKLELNIGAAGTYTLFDNAYNGEIVATTNMYDIAQDGNNVVVTTKDAGVVAAESGMSADSASALVAMANTTDNRLNTVSIAAQKSLAVGDVATIEREIGKLRPSATPVSQSVTTSNHSQVLNLASGRMVGRNGGDMAAEYGAWAQGLFNKSKHDDKFNAYTRGIAVGFDANVDNVYTIGVGYAFNHSDINVNDRDTEVDTNTLFLYGQYKPNQWYVNGTISYTMADYTEDVMVYGTPFSAEYNVDSFGAQAIVGHDFATGIALEGGLRYLRVSQDSYDNGFGTVKTKDTDFLSGVAGLKYSFAIDSDTAILWRPELRASATYDFVSDDAFATIVIPGTNPYTVASESLSRMGGEFGIGLTAEYKGLEVSLNYDLDLHKDYTSQTGMVRLRYDF